MLADSWDRRCLNHSVDIICCCKLCISSTWDGILAAGRVLMQRAPAYARRRAAVTDHRLYIQIPWQAYSEFFPFTDRSYYDHIQTMIHWTQHAACQQTCWHAASLVPFASETCWWIVVGECRRHTRSASGEPAKWLMLLTFRDRKSRRLLTLASLVTTLYAAFISEKD